MGWLREKYTREYFLGRDVRGHRLPYGVYGVEYWEKGEMYPRGKRLLDSLNLSDAIVLDIGFGRGDGIKYCLQRGAAYVTGIDFADAALKIAYLTLEGFPRTNYRLLCEDVLDFLLKEPKRSQFTHVLMMDVIEHIPREQVEKLLPEIYDRLIPGGYLVIHTPFYPEDDNVFVTGGKKICMDSSDQFEETRGMHVNRYSFNGLGEHLARFGFARLGAYIFLRPANHYSKKC